MAFAGDEHHAAGLRLAYGGAYGLAAVGDAECLAHIGGGEACLHVGDDRVGLFEAGIVGGQDQMVGAKRGLAGHHRALSMVAVAAAAHHCRDLAVGADDLADRVEHIDQCVRRMRVVYDRHYPVGIAEGLESARHRHQLAHIDEHLLLREAQKHGGSVDIRQVVGVEFAREIHLHLAAVEHQQGPVETCLQDLAAEVGVATQRICVFARFGVLKHIHPCLVIDVDQSEGIGREHVEK